MTFKDFVPEGEDAGHLGEGGFRDFVSDEEMEANKALKKEFEEPSMRWTLDSLVAHAEDVGVVIGKNPSKTSVLKAISLANTLKEEKPKKVKKAKKARK